MRRYTKLRIAQTGAAFNAFRPQGQRAADTPEVCEHNQREAPQHQARVAQTGAAFNAFRPQGTIMGRRATLSVPNTPIGRHMTWRWRDRRAAYLAWL